VYGTDPTLRAQDSITVQDKDSGEGTSAVSAFNTNLRHSKKE